ncbi:ArsR/SmtB family transcription factor [Actinomycetospora soli]|uniref:ArsR/SmtB family transcription factor n=1 Tax=Actinomycetospora soli TaxID=2893887 RepID=UPI0027E35919|nr:metalloregulator ArsR/SmtB family transcription factor [Actinomycetospora soli]
MHLTGDPDAVGVDGDHRVCAAVEALPDAATMHGWVSRFALLADPTRLTLLLCIHEVGEICVSDLALAAGLKDSTTSQALRLLRAQNLVSAHRDGRVVRYRLADAVVKDLLDRIHDAGSVEPFAPLTPTGSTGSPRGAASR